MRTLGHLLFSLAVTLTSISPSGAQTNSKRVSYRSTAATLGKVLPEIGAKAGIDLRPAANIADELLLVRVEDAPVGELMTKIAQAVGAEWVQEGDIYRLARPNSIIESERRAEIEERAKRLRRALEKFTADVRKSPNWTLDDVRAAKQKSQRDANQQRQLLQGQNIGGTLRSFSFGGGSEISPAGRALARMISMVNINDLAALESGERVVFSTSPTRMQKSIAGGVQEVFRILAQEQRLWDQLQDTSPGQQGGILRRPLPGGASPSGPASRALIIASRMGFGDAIQLTLLVSDANGNVVASHMGLLGEIAIAFGSDREQNPEVDYGPAQPIALSDEAKAFGSMLNSAGGLMGSAINFSIETGAAGDSIRIVSPMAGATTKRMPLSPEWRQKIVSPTTWEPLASLPSELVLAVADAQSSNLIASLPDESLVRSTSLLGSNGTPNTVQVLQAMETSWDMKVTREGNFMVARPVFPVTARKTKANRVRLERLLRNLDRNERLSLDDLAAYAYGQPSARGPDSLDSALLRLLDPIVADQEFLQGMSGQRDMLRLWGSFSPSQRQSLAGGYPLPVGSLSADQQAIVARMTYHSIDGPRLAEAGRGIEGFFGMLSSLRSERTEFLPNGLPGDLVITMRAENQLAVIARNSETGSGAVLTPVMMAMARGVQANLNDLSNVLRMPSYDQFLMADQQTLNFTFQYGRLARLQRQLTDAVPQRGAKPAPYEALPEAFRKQVDEIARRMQNRGGGGRNRGGGTTQPTDRPDIAPVHSGG